MKKKNSYIVAACTLSFAQMGCSDLLDQAPQGGTYRHRPRRWYVRERNIRNVRCHARLCPDIGNNRTVPSTASVRKTRKKAVHRQTEAGAAKMYDEFNYDASDGMLQGYWSANYNLIHKVNTLLESMKAGNLTDGNLVNKAEALFFRAYCYFNLVACIR